jgi:hypothetical protein
MQSNVRGDWSNFKSKYSLEKGITPSVTNSLYSGIRILATKGFKGGVTYDAKTGQRTFTFKGWESATRAYNGGGIKNYQHYIQIMVSESRTPVPSDY